MKKASYVVLAIVVIAGYISINIYFSRTAVFPFNAKPEACSEISNSLSLVSSEKLRTTYAHKIIVYREYSPDKHRNKHPQDVAIRTDPGDKSNIVVILTNNDPYDSDYFVSDNVALAKR